MRQILPLEQLAEDHPRRVLDRLIASSGGDYFSLSRMLGRNPAYIQQFVRRGSPRVLAEADRRRLAEFFGVDEAALGAPPARSGPPTAPDALVAVTRLDIGASAGGGALADDDYRMAPMAFDPHWLRRLAPDPSQLSIIRVDGDSMAPTLNDGDEIMVNAGDGAARLRDGIYVLRRDDTLLVKRLARGAQAAAVNIISDNAAYPMQGDVPIAQLTIVGRVVWASRRIG